jgi:hypothetical protein
MKENFSTMFILLIYSLKVDSVEKRIRIRFPVPESGSRSDRIWNCLRFCNIVSEQVKVFYFSLLILPIGVHYIVNPLTIVDNLTSNS